MSQEFEFSQPEQDTWHVPELLQDGVLMLTPPVELVLDGVAVAERVASPKPFLPRPPIRPRSPMEEPARRPGPRRRVDHPAPLKRRSK